MTRISKKEEYALMALKFLAEKSSKNHYSAKEIAEYTGCSFDIVTKVLRALSIGQIVAAHQGVKGGFSLSRSLDQVSFYEFSQLVAGPVGIAQCLLQESCSIQERCNIISPVHILNQKITNLYKSITLDSILYPNKSKIHEGGLCNELTP